MQRCLKMLNCQRQVSRCGNVLLSLCSSCREMLIISPIALHRTDTIEMDVPLCVDLDGTLLRTDMVWESLVQLLKRNPLYLFLVLGWLLRGRAYLKAQIAARVHMEVAALPCNQELVEFLRTEKHSGRTIILATASDSRLAQRIAAHFGIFDEVL